VFNVFISEPFRNSFTSDAFAALRDIHASIQDTSATYIENSTLSGGFTGSSLHENDINNRKQRKRYFLREPEKKPIIFINAS